MRTKNKFKTLSTLLLSMLMLVIATFSVSNVKRVKADDEDFVLTTDIMTTFVTKTMMAFGMPNDSILFIEEQFLSGVTVEEVVEYGFAGLLENYPFVSIIYDATPWDTYLLFQISGYIYYGGLLRDGWNNFGFYDLEFGTDFENNQNFINLLTYHPNIYAMGIWHMSPDFYDFNSLIQYYCATNNLYKRPLISVILREELLEDEGLEIFCTYDWFIDLFLCQGMVLE